MGNTCEARRQSTLPPESQRSKAAEMLAAKAGVYQHLSRLLGPPDRAFLDREIMVPLRSALTRSGLDPCQTEVAAAEDYLGGLATLTPLAVEYVRLFRGPARAAAYPYESIYVDGGIMGPSTMAVMDSYRDGGMDVAEDFPDLPDHVCVEMEFMHYLYYMAFQACREQDPANQLRFERLRDSFLTEHLGKWIANFLDAVFENTTSPFYRTLALVCGEFMRRELSEAAG